jgi:regulation of enolase protein 1 (concanavalin A-like superfamily)
MKEILALIMANQSSRLQISSAVDYDVYLIKTDSLGDTLWTRTYGGGYDDVGYSVQQTSDGGYIITGMTESFDVNSGDVYLIKTDAFGNQFWETTFGGSFKDAGHSIQQTSDGGYIITGSKDFQYHPPLYPWAELCLIKTDSWGETLWTRTFGDTSLDQGMSVQQTSDGGYIITGFFSFDPIERAIYLIKTDVNGMVGIEEEKSEFGIRNAEFGLKQNHPNPFHKLTAICYQLGAPSHTSLKIYDITGRLVETLVDKRQEPGVYQIQWDGNPNRVHSGIYFYRLSTRIGQDSGFSKTKKLILLK